jgi:predicted glycosyltransferase involved in capsule biosynthesis
MDLKMNSIISIITPFFCLDINEYIYERAKFYIKNTHSNKKIERILVDQGSPRIISKEIEALCSENNFKYINLGKGNLSFSIGMCRNAGVQYANSEYISFSDIDLFSDDDFYERILLKLDSGELPYNYLETIPCIYLSEDASRKYVDSLIGIHDIYESYLSRDTDIIAMVAPASSCLIARKHFYLSEGGVRDEFFGHGYEDFELMNRLAIKSRKFHRSHDYYSHEFKYDSLEYKGYRTFFAMFGRRNLAEKLFYIHLYHPTVNNPAYKKRNKDNKIIFEKLLKDFDIKKISPPALSDLNSNIKTLIIGNKNSLSFKAVREVLPKFGFCDYRNEDSFESECDFEEFLSSQSYDYCLFSNPYGNEYRLRLYGVAKKSNVKVFCYDRGALPDSWFFDINDFNARSSSYSIEKWGRELKDEEVYFAEKYIHDLCSSENVLEKNGPRIGGFNLKNKINAGSRKILFVPLQRPNDSVIKYFSGSVEGVDDFAHQISVFAQANINEWLVVVKKHPLETECPYMPGCTYLDPDTHVHDVLEACDAVALINSGVGLLSLCFGKPVYCFGEAFYAQPGLAKRVSNWEALQSGLNAVEMDSNRVLQFIFYLVNNFYCFAKADYREVVDGASKRTEVVDLRFNKINIETLCSYDVLRIDEPFSTSTPYYDYHRAYFIARNENVGNPIPVAKALPVKKPEALQESVEKEVQSSGQSKSIAVASQKIIPNQSSFDRKFKKLLRDPVLFVKDAIKK